MNAKPVHHVRETYLKVSFLKLKSTSSDQWRKYFKTTNYAKYKGW